MVDDEQMQYYISQELSVFDGLYSYNQEYRLKYDENLVLWRYMDITKFLNIIDTNSLFFSKPKNFIDPYEGNFSKYDLGHMRVPSFFVVREKVSEFVKSSNEQAAVLCWHMNNFESAAMWDLYLPSSEGIAIKTNSRKLLNSIKDKRFAIYGGKVQYINYKTDMASTNVFETLFYKRESFSHEKELRLVVFADPILDNAGHLNINCWETDDDNYEGTTEFDTESGTNIEIDVREMIEEIYISPAAPKWIEPLLKSILQKYDLQEIPVNQSKLYNDLIY